MAGLLLMLVRVELQNELREQLAVLDLGLCLTLHRNRVILEVLAVQVLKKVLL